MALSPLLSYSERNDNRLLTLTDVTVFGAPEILVSGITALTLDITITTSDSTSTTYDQIDLYALYNGPFSAQSELVYEISCASLLDNGIALGTTSDELPDGIWDFTYTINAEPPLEQEVLIDGVVRAAVYELLRAIPTIYNCNECKSKTVLDAIYCYGCLNVLESDAYIAKTEELLSLLYTLERLILNGSNYTW